MLTDSGTSEAMDRPGHRSESGLSYGATTRLALAVLTGLELTQCRTSLPLRRPGNVEFPYRNCGILAPLGLVGYITPPTRL